MDKSVRNYSPLFCTNIEGLKGVVRRTVDRRSCAFDIDIVCSDEIAMTRSDSSQ